ncbi:MAG: phage integrase central domain-containing protein, partial [Nocardioides sp.]
MAQLRDGVMRRGRTWSYVIRVTNPQTGLSTPKWVGGFATEKEAKAARDKARVAARRGEYVSRSRVTVAGYLREWLATHQVEVKPKTHEDYRRLLESYVIPHLGRMTLQSLRPATLSTLYATLIRSGGKDGRPLSARTVGYVHAVLRKALNDAVVTD